MEIERKLVEYIVETPFAMLPDEVIGTAKNVVRTVLGTTVAGAKEEGCETLSTQVKEWGGKEEATILIHGGLVPAHNAVLVNSAMARALDFCDAMSMGIHLGSSTIPTGLAVAELMGGVSGREFLTALVVGTEVASRIHFSSIYDGFDPTGVCTIFATTAIAGRILGLKPEQMLNALAIAFNKAGGSMQSNIDGSLAVRLNQGFASQGGIISAQLARRGFTGPMNFLDGIYGYFHLYAKDRYEPEAIIGELGERFELTKTIFKKYPSCGGTLASTDAILELVANHCITPEDIAKIIIKVTPPIYKLVGHPFKIGKNPRVNAQFSIQYCVANALLRGSSKLNHFEDNYVREPKVLELIDKISVINDPNLEKRTRLTVEMEIHTKQGAAYHKVVDYFRGTPENPLTNEEHLERFQDCVRYADDRLPQENVEKILYLVSQLEELPDVCSLIPLLLPQKSKVRVDSKRQ